MDKHLVKKDILSIQQLILPYINHDDANRLQMVSSHLVQALPLLEGEIPISQSIYNKDMVKYSDMIVKAKEKTDNLGKIKLMDEEFLLVKTEKEIELIKIDIPLLSSAFTARHTFVTDKQVIEKDENILVKGNATEEGNLKIGTNGLVGYMLYGTNFEDSIIISESFAKKLTHVEKDVVTFIINANEYLLNIYGDKDNYKCLPEIGEYINPNSRIICAKRFINKGFHEFFELTSKANSKINFFGGDTIYYNNGKVVDICVYSNLDEEELETKTEFYNSIKPYIDRNNSDINHFLELVKPYEKLYKDNTKDFTFGPNLQYYYNKFRKIGKGNVLTYNDKKFNGLLVKIIVEREVKAELGTKLTNRNGGKGVITKIMPDRDMPMRISDKKHLDIILSPNSVIGRINLGQIHETTINRISEEVYKEFISKETNEESLKLFLEFMKDLLPERLHSELKQIEKLKGDKLKDFINSIKDDGVIYIPQVPFENISIENISKWYNRYKLENDFVSINGNKLMNPILTGQQYFLKIKHEPSKKISATNIKKIGTKTLQPAKAGLEHKMFKSPISSSPNTIGEQESSILMALSEDMYIMKELALLKSSDYKNREKFIYKLYSEEEIKISDFDNLESVAITNLNYYLNVIGLKL